jgi:hypothetical protein
VIFFSFVCGLLFIKKLSYEEPFDDAAVRGGGPMFSCRSTLLGVLSLGSPQYFFNHPDKDLSAATTFKYPSDGYVDFGTRLFLRMEKTMLESTPQVRPFLRSAQ